MTDLLMLDRLADFLAADILNLIDEEVLAEFRADGGDPEPNAAECRALFERTLKMKTPA